MDWIIVNHQTHRPLNETRYTDEPTAEQSITLLGPVLSAMYETVPDYHTPRWRRVLTEGLQSGDLEGIILPQFSVDLYVPGDPETDNIVIGFLVKGVPEAVYPLRIFCQYCDGVEHVDYGDSDTIPNTSIVYVEFNREQFKIQDLDTLVHQISRLAQLQAEDFTMVFPTSSKYHPYSLPTLTKYFEARTQGKNMKAQKQAIQDRTQQIQRELEQELQSGTLAKRIDPKVAAAGGSPTVATPEQPKSSGGNAPHANRMVGLATNQKMKTSKEIEISEPIKLAIVSDARRNRLSKNETWEEFDKRWSQRLRVAPKKVSSIRKKVYETRSPVVTSLVDRIADLFETAI